MQRYLGILNKAKIHSLIFLKWSLISVVTGLAVGAVSVIFSKAMTFVTDFRNDNDIIIYFLPAAGLFVVFLYRALKVEEDRGTNLILASVSSDDDIPVKVAPLIFISTVITHLFGGSAGREGAALQLGGSLGNGIGRIIRLDEKDKKIIIMCGMSSAFSAIFGTPMAAAVFPIEVATVGVMYYTALMPCIFSSLVASHFAAGMGIHPESFEIAYIPKENPGVYAKVVLLSVLCALLSIILCIVLHDTASLFKKFIKNPYMRVVAGAAIIIASALLLNTRDYLGAGIPVIERAMRGEVRPEAFVMKMLFTAITLGIGFKGGEIVPSFFIGATFGCLVGNIIGLSPSMCAALGMAGVFCGVTNSPISTMLISFELFGFKGVPYFLIAIAISYVLSGYIGLYSEQIFEYSKYKVEKYTKNV